MNIQDQVAEAVDAVEASAPRAKACPLSFKKDLDAARKARSSEVFLWNLTIRFLAGEQNLDFDWEKRQFVTQSARPGRNQIVEDQLRPIWNALSNVLSVDYPAVAVSPAMPCYDDITKALASEQLGRYHWNTNKMSSVYRTLVEWLLACGTAGLHTYWDEDGQKLLTKAVSGFDILAEAGATSDEQADWHAVRTTVKRSDLLKVPEYKKFKTEIQEAPASNKEMAEGDRNRVAPQPQDRLDTWDVYFQDGRHGVLLNDTWLWEGGYKVGEKPLIFFRYNVLPGRFWGQSVMVLLLDLQRQLNHVNNLILDLMDSNSNLVWLVPFNAGVNIRNLNNAPDGVVGYTASNGTPTRLPAPAIPPHLFEIRRQVVQAMMDVAGIHSTTLGKRAVGISSKVAIEAMVNQDTSQLQGTMDNIETGTHDLMVTVLSMYKRKLTGPMAIKMLDKAMGRVIYKELEATSLMDHPEIEIATGSLFRTELQDRNQQVLDLMDRKMISPEQAMKQMTLHLGNQDAMKRMVNYSHAQELLEAVKKGAQIEILPYVDDLETIRDVFDEYVKSPEYYLEALFLKQQHDRTGNPELTILHDKAVAKQDYIRDILVSVSLPPDATPDQIAQATQARVFPRATPNADKASVTALANASAETASQSADVSAQLAARKQLVQSVDQAADIQPAGIAGGVGG